jgi:SAM-dependent methyltransferase
VLDLFPRASTNVADIGSGTGRDAAWLAGRGHRVVAVEPVKALREAGMTRHRSRSIEWLDDRLPELAIARSRGPFGLIILGGVWQHLDDDERQRAMTTIGGMTLAGGLVVLSLRHGPGAEGRRVFPVSPDRTIAAAGECGLDLLRRVETASLQAENRARGVRWTWLALKKVR